MKKILVIQQKMIGDVLMSSAICEAIKKSWPTTEVHYMVNSNTVPVVLNNPFIDKLVIFDPKLNKGFLALRKFGRQLRKNRYDAVIDAYQKWESIVPMLYSGAPVRIGHYKKFRTIFYSTVVKQAKSQGSALVNRLQLAHALTGEKPAMDFPRIYLSSEELSAASERLKSINGSPIMISVLGSTPTKSLPAGQMAKMLDFIADATDVSLLFNFMPQQEAEAREIFDLCKKSTQSKIVFDLYSNGLRDFLGVLSHCSALIGNEGGAVNMAKALRIPTFTVFSPWINKSSWNMLTDDKLHVAVHLKDFEPNLYGEMHAKNFKRRSKELYGKLDPDRFKQRLADFLSSNIRKSNP